MAALEGGGMVSPVTVVVLLGVAVRWFWPFLRKMVPFFVAAVLTVAAPLGLSVTVHKAGELWVLSRPLGTALSPRRVCSVSVGVVRLALAP